MTIEEQNIRISAFLWLKEKAKYNNGIFKRTELEKEFFYNDRWITLMGAAGIWFPKGFEIPISITTTIHGPYDDKNINENGILTYKYRGDNPGHRDNVGLRKAFETRTPLIYFHAVSKGKYQAIWPIYIYNDDPNNLQIKAAIDFKFQENIYDSSYIDSVDPLQVAENEPDYRRYVMREQRQRLHQSAFREIVLDAYSNQCTLCRLQHPELLDAAHIISDSEDEGLPIVQNGLSMCKIHHAAYDQNIIGINPDFQIKVRDAILEEEDGPMLKYGLQSLEGERMILPARKSDYPDRGRLEKRYGEFII